MDHLGHGSTLCFIYKEGHILLHDSSLFHKSLWKSSWSCHQTSGEVGILVPNRQTTATPWWWRWWCILFQINSSRQELRAFVVSVSGVGCLTCIWWYFFISSRCPEEGLLRNPPFHLFTWLSLENLSAYSLVPSVVNLHIFYIIFSLLVIADDYYKKNDIWVKKKGKKSKNSNVNIDG